jgi:hypothetical protein
MTLAFTQLTLASVGDLNDGAAEAIINREIQTAVRDIDDRGHDGKPRKVVIEITMQQNKGDDGRITVDLDVAAQAKVPPRRTGTTVAKPFEKDGKVALLFQEFNAENPDQGTFPVLDKEKNRRME